MYFTETVHPYNLLPAGIACIVYPLSTRPLRRQFRISEYHPEKLLLSWLSQARKYVKISFAYFRNAEFARTLSRFISQSPTVKWQFILGESSVTDYSYKEATTVLTKIAKQYPRRCRVKVLFGDKSNRHFGKIVPRFIVDEVDELRELFS